MAIVKNRSFFGASYADLMTSLFFVMLALFILTVLMLQKQMKEIEIVKEATEAEMDKIREIQDAISNIDSTFFAYNKEHKKHVLKISVEFEKEKSDIYYINDEIRQQLLNAGKAIKRFIQDACRKYNAQYLLIIEGQASKDDYKYNYRLSYERALALFQYWEENGVVFDSEQCEVIISGSGQNGTLRVQPDVKGNVKNQRFLIHILPKPGIID